MIKIQVSSSILEIPAEKWAGITARDFPFTSYHYLSALETSGCLGQRTGWEPRIVSAWQAEELLGAVVLYLKSNSYGEYIFDFAWAQAYEHSGLKYYPKLTSAVPFTPATGPKLLLRPGADSGVSQALLAGVDQLATGLGVSSLHALFVPEPQLEAYTAAGYFLRTSYQFHWQNEGYGDFKEFLSQLRSKRRREIVRERAQVTSAKVRIERLTGEELTSAHGEIFYKFYLNTIDKRQSYDYLTKDFFMRVFAEMKDSLLLVLASDGDGPVAGALYYMGEKTLYGRNWGCVQEHRALHFELCYYQGIEFAIEKGFTKFEAGAQGEHKFQRGFMPAQTHSAHKIYHPDLMSAIRAHVQMERTQIAEVFKEYKLRSPFRD